MSIEILQCVVCSLHMACLHGQKQLSTLLLARIRHRLAQHSAAQHSTALAVSSYAAVLAFKTIWLKHWLNHASLGQQHLFHSAALQMCISALLVQHPNMVDDVTPFTAT